MLYTIAAWAFAGAVLAWMTWCAPNGWEDSDGFHYGDPE